MTDKELIQLYKMCNELETCEECPERSDFGHCPIDRYCDLDELKFTGRSRNMIWWKVRG